MFKVGDKVVYRKQCSIIWEGVYTVDAVLSNGDVIERDCQTPREWLSRATSEEISAGHRIRWLPRSTLVSTNQGPTIQPINPVVVTQLFLSL